MTKRLFNTIALSLSFLQMTITAQARTIPAECFTEVTEGTFYLYNTIQGQFLTRLANNYPGWSNAPSQVTLKRKSDAFTIMFDDGKYLKTGYWNNQYLWTDGTASAAESLWQFEPIEDKENVYRLKRSTSDVLNGSTGIFYANGINAAVQATNDCQWALVDCNAYISLAKEQAIPEGYRSAAPESEDSYYIYDVLNGTFLNTSNCTVSEQPSELVTITPTGSAFLLSGAKDKYLKLGVYKGQYLWSDGDATSTLWQLESTAGEEGEKLYYIYSNSFSETNTEVAGKTWYLTGTNASTSKPSIARWALISKADFTAYMASGEGYVDAADVASHKEQMLAEAGNATSLIQSPSFERSADGWWGGSRILSQLYRGSGYACELTETDNSMLQSVRNMPRGTYKVVAAVRGENRSMVFARVAGTEGNTVVNFGQSTAYDQLNQNGVKMPYSALGGFNDDQGSLGWDFVTAMGTLQEDGHLTVEFVLDNQGSAQVTDIHLYYMSDDNSIYATDYQKDVDATQYAVTCDLTVSNPNEIFTSIGNIETISGAVANNNLVGGVVSNLVLYDGYDFFASSDFLANKATFYGMLPAGTARTICLPFSAATSDNGDFYEIKNVEDGRLNMVKANNITAGTPYIYLGTSGGSQFTGRGIVKALPNNMQTPPALVGSFISKANLPDNSYILAKDVMKLSGAKESISAFQAYLIADGENSKLKVNFDAAEEDGIWQKPTVESSDLEIGIECYLYNIGACGFYTEGNSYGTQASIGETGLKVKFINDGKGTKLNNYSEVKNAWFTTFVTTNGAMYVDGSDVSECYWEIVPGEDNNFKMRISEPNGSFNQTNYPGAMMGLDLFENNLRTNLAALLFAEEEPGEGIYLTDWATVSVADYETYQQAVSTYKTALQLKQLLSEAQLSGVDISAEQTVYENTESTATELTAAIVSVTNKMIESELAGASADNPLDLTDKFITNPRYESNDNEGWSGSTPSIDAANNLQNAEFFNTNFDYYQDLVGLPEGYYQLSLNAFYRAGLEAPALAYKQSGDEDAVMHALLYATTGGQETVQKIQSIFTGAPSTALGVTGEIKNGSWWVPNTMSSAAAYFAADYYQGNSLLVYVANGQLRIGLRKSTTIRRDWVMIDNWKLEYLGKDNPQK